MEIIDCIQGSEEWLKHRMGVATASNFSKLITSKGEISIQMNDYILSLVGAELSSEPEETFTSFDMKRGTRLEPEARQVYQEHTFNLVEQVGFIKCGHFGYSSDGLVGSDGTIEIKCPKLHNHVRYLYMNSLPIKYKAQIQGGLAVTDRKWCDFISYHPDLGDKKLLIIRVQRDQDFIDKLLKILNYLNNRKQEILAKIRS